MAEWRRPVEIRIERVDRHRILVWIALAGLVLGSAMAVFGLPPVNLHGPAHFLGIMSPTCGGTRSVWAAMSGDLGASWRYNPLGTVLVVGAVGTLVRFAIGVSTGRWVNVRVRSWPVPAVLGGALFLALGIRQQLNVDLLRTPQDEFSLAGPLLNLGVVLVVVAVLGVRYRWAPSTRRV
ncbi:DUF2752 domain-containing protein [Lipingzhangella sp. LS1_29]|uniref:DUF2752 domain-containing protein n=1 Tax=Lipingzhangella rawalii TaxID=2055835 RepID=A0ABU2H6G5_9ACTN|nr:DUF2752 domain-containing protein [Lipingzhangella rawalii]MDS1270873.1 DUF2752 domain-containing protein [Lipingzhangella rawalii]